MVDSQKMRLSKAAAVILLIVLLAGAGGAYWAYRQGRLYFSDPAMPRKNPTYEEVFVSPKGVEASPNNEMVFGKTTIETNGAQIRVMMSGNSNIPKAELPFTLHRANASEAVQIENGTIRLSYLITGWATPSNSREEWGRVSGTIYGPDLRAMQSNEVKLNRWERELQPRGDFPSAKFFFGVTNVPEFKLVRFQSFDARTHRILNSGTSSSWTPNAFWVENDIRLWHQTPIELVSTLAVGPAEVIEENPEPGQEIRFPGGSLKLIVIVPERINGWGSSSEGKTNIVTLSLNRGEVIGYTNESSFVFSVWPGTTELPIDLELIDENGKKMDSAGGGSSERVLISSVFEKQDRVKKIRLKYYPNVHRIAWTLPELPGLPEENRNIRNLFDVRVPYMRFQYEWNYQDDLRQLVAMEMDPLTLQYPNGFFPLVRTNFTAREMLREIESKLPDQKQLSVNAKENRIELRRPVWELVVERIKTMFRK